MKIIDKIGLKKVVSFVKNELEDYSVDQLDSISILPWRVNKKDAEIYNCTWGICIEQEKGLYRIKAGVNVNDDLYPMRDRRWIWVPDKKKGKSQKKAEWKYDNIEEAAVAVIFHEIFHYLAWTNQMFDREAKKIKNVEANANWFAHGMVAKFGQPLEVIF